MRRCTAALLAAGVVLAGCYKDDPAGVRGDAVTTVELTDAPFPYDSVARVDLYIASIAVRAEPDTSSGATGWITVATPRHRYNLIDLASGATDTVGGTVIPAGQYRAVRMVIETDSSSITATDGSTEPIDWQASVGQPSLYALVENPIGVPDTGTSIVIDVDAGRSFLCAEPCHTFTFSPVFRAVSRYATGTVTGHVAGDTTAHYPTPIRDVTVTAYVGNPALDTGTWSAQATGRTDPNGSFTLAYLLPGTYILRADAPRGSPFTPGVRSGITVTAGQTTSGVMITLPQGSANSIVVSPELPYMYQGDSLNFTATEVDTAGHAVPGASYQWFNLDTTIASIWQDPYQPQQVLLKALAPGTARLQVNADNLVRVLTIPVLAPPPGGAIAAIHVTPDSATLPVFDSLNFTAAAVDTGGVALPSATFTWTSSDSTVASVENILYLTRTANVRAHHSGIAVITASSGGTSGTATVTVP